MNLYLTCDPLQNILAERTVKKGVGGGEEGKEMGGGRRNCQGGGNRGKFCNNAQYLVTELKGHTDY